MRERRREKAREGDSAGWWWLVDRAGNKREIGWRWSREEKNAA
jgi:hypothetical protein